MSSKLPVILMVEHVRSSHNVGSLFRTADAANIERIIFSNTCPVPPRTDISKTALGAENTVPWSQVDSIHTELTSLKTKGYTVVALELTPSAIPLQTTPVKTPTVLIVGHEREGISKETLALCDLHVCLPMHGTSARSLNVSNATSIALYELGRRVWYHGSI